LLFLLVLAVVGKPIHSAVLKARQCTRRQRQANRQATARHPAKLPVKQSARRR
jgi:hypothetical protein